MKIILNKELLDLINRAKNVIKDSDAYLDICEEYAANLDYIDFVPVAFADLEVSARTDNGVIYINKKYSDNINDICKYLIHEFTHWCQQCLSDGPTIQEANYLDDQNELEAFEHQVDFIGDNEGMGEAKEYVDKLLDHHNVSDGERDKYESILLD